MVFYALLESKQCKKSVEMHVFSEKCARSAEITSAPRLPILPGARIFQRKRAFPQTSYIALTLARLDYAQSRLKVPANLLFSVKIAENKSIVTFK